MKYIAKRKNTAGIFLACTLGMIILVLVTLISFNVPFRSIFELCAMFAAVGLIQICQRHIFSSYEYILDSSDELLSHNRITVVKVVGKKRTSLFTLKLALLTAVEPYSSKKKLKKKYGKKASFYNFAVDISPKESYLLIFEHDGEASILRLQCDAEFKNELENRAGF